MNAQGSSIEIARAIIAAHGTPFEISEIATLIAAAADAQFSPATLATDREIDAVLWRVFGAPWRARLEMADETFTPTTREELLTHSALAFADWHHLRKLHDRMLRDSREHPAAVDDVAQRRDAAQARHRDYTAALARLDDDGGMLDSWCLDEALLG